MRGQVSIEYLVILGLTIGILIPAVFFFYQYSKSDAGASTSAQVNDIGLRMVSTTKSTYALGNGAWQTMEFVMPETVTRVYVTPNKDELVIVYDTVFGPTDAVFYSNVNMTPNPPDGNISAAHPGRTRYRFTSNGREVNITETT